MTLEDPEVMQLKLLSELKISQGGDYLGILLFGHKIMPTGMDPNLQSKKSVR